MRALVPTVAILAFAIVRPALPRPPRLIWMALAGPALPVAPVAIVRNILLIAAAIAVGRLGLIAPRLGARWFSRRPLPGQHRAFSDRHGEPTSRWAAGLRPPVSRSNQARMTTPISSRRRE